MAKISKDCLDEAYQALRNFTKDELNDYALEVFAKAAKYSDVKNMAAFDRAMREINDSRLKEYFNDSVRKANNILNYERNAKFIREKGYTFKELLSPRGEHLGDSLSGAQKAELNKMYTQFLGDLNSEEFEYLSSGKFDLVIGDIVDGKDINDPTAKKMADKLNKYWQYAKSELVTSGAMKFSELNEQRLFRSFHDQEKVLNGNKSLIQLAKEFAQRVYDPAAHREAWKNTIKQHLDMEETFSKTEAMNLDGSLDMAKVDEILNNIYNNITTGKSTIFTRSVVANDREAMANKSRMFFVWKGLRSQLEYNKIYGKGNLFNMLLSDMRATANKVGVANMWGDSPFKMYNDLKHVQEEVSHKDGRWWRNADLIFNDIMDLNKGSVAPTLTKFMANVRTLTSMVRLPLIALQSTSDIGYIAAFAQRIGINYFDAWTNQVGHMFDLMPTSERTRIAKLMQSQIHSHIGYMGRWAEINNSSDFLSKMSAQFFKKNALEAFDRGNRIGIMHLMSKHLNDNSDKMLDQLDPQLRKWVGKFMDAKEWDLLRKKNSEGLFTTDNVDDLTNDELKAHYDSGDKGIALSNLRGDLYRKVFSMFSVASENAVLAPSEFERAWMYGGTTLGTPVGEVMRMVGQFKLYGIAYIDRVLMAGWKDADSVSQRLKWATSMLIGTLPLSILSNQLNYLAQGKSLPDPRKMNVPERLKYLLETIAPSLTISGGLLSERNQGRNLWFSLLGSPQTALYGNALSAPLALAEGDPARAKKYLEDALSYMVPTKNIPIITPLFRQMMGDQAQLQPGQQQYYGR